MSTKYRVGFTLMAFAMLMSVEVRGGEAPLPDLTKGTGGIDRSLTYNLGGTGMRGWIYTPHWQENIASLDAMQGRTTGSSRQILVTHVGDKSPADGVMKVDDVILGIDDQPFTDDARKTLAKAIQKAEKEPLKETGSNNRETGKKTRSGHLALLRWRAGKTETVELKMRVLGTYSDTAPYNCPKSAKILEEACAALQKETGMWQEISGLAMVATGDPRFLPQIKAIAQAVAQAVGPSTLKYDMAKQVSVWHMGFQEWITAAEGTNARLRLGACEALHQLKTQQALTVFVRLLYHEDRGLRFLAARAIKDLGVAAQPGLNDILKAFVDTAEPLVPVNFADPIQFAHGQLIPALFSGGLTDALKQADPKLVLEAVRVGSKNADNMARSNLEGFINRLTVDEVKTLLPDIVELAVSHGPADTMFSREIRVSAFKVLVEYHFQEGIRAAPLVAKGKYGCHNAVEIMAALETYGSAAREIVPDLKRLIVDYKELLKEWQFPDSTIPAVEHAIKVIEAAKDHPELLSAGSTPTMTEEPKK